MKFNVETDDLPRFLHQVADAMSRLRNVDEDIAKCEKDVDEDIPTYLILRQE